MKNGLVLLLLAVGCLCASHATAQTGAQNKKDTVKAQPVKKERPPLPPPPPPPPMPPRN